MVHLQLLSVKQAKKDWLRFRLFGERLDLRVADLSEGHSRALISTKVIFAALTSAGADLTEAHFTGADLVAVWFATMVA
jgi:hypothetical protein